MSDHNQFSASSHSVSGDVIGNYDCLAAEGQFAELDVDSIIESIKLFGQRLNENAEAMKELYHRRQSTMAKFCIENSASFPVPNSGTFLSSTELEFCESEMDVLQYHVPESLGMDIPRHADTLNAVGPPVSSVTVVAQQPVLTALSPNTQTRITELGDESLPCREVASYQDKRTRSFAPAYMTFPQSTTFDYGHAQEIAFSGAGPCLPGQAMGPVALVDTSDSKNDHARSSVRAPPRDRPTVLSFIFGGIKHYHCECGYKSTRKGDVHHHLESLRHSERKYECSCSKKFTRYDSLDRHKKRCKTIVLGT